MKYAESDISQRDNYPTTVLWSTPLHSTRRSTRAEVQSNLTPTTPRQRSNLRSLKWALYLLFDLLSGYLFTIIRTEDIPLDESGIVICEVIRDDFHRQVWIE